MAQCVLTRMPERRVTQIMRQTSDLDDSANIARGIVFGQESAGLQHDADAVTQTASDAGLLRSEERRVGKECRSRWSPYH